MARNDDDDENIILEYMANTAKRKVRSVIREFIRANLGVIVPIVGLIILILFVAFVSACSVYAFSDAGKLWFSENGTKELSDDELNQLFNDPQKMLDAIDMDKFQPGNSGYFYMTEADLKKILQSVIDYNNRRKRECTVEYTAYHHRFYYQETRRLVIDENGNLKEVIDVVTEHYASEVDGYEVFGTKSFQSLETSDEFNITWQEIYCLLVIKALDDTSIWKEQKEAKDLNGNGVTDTTKVTPLVRVKQEDIDAIINAFTYDFGYYCDPTSEQIAKYEYADMENHAYVPTDPFDESKRHVDGEALPNNIDYYHVKAPAMAPAYAVNSYKSVVWNYDASGILRSRTITSDPDVFVEFCKKITNKNFDFGWYLYLLKALPGTNVSVSGKDSAMAQFETLYKAWKDEVKLHKEETDFELCNNVQLGSQVVMYDLPEFNPGNGESGGVIGDLPNGDGSLTGHVLSEAEIEKLLSGVTDPFTKELLKDSLGHVGGTYVYGAAGPNVFDCSGFIQYMYGKYGIALPRVSYEQADAGIPITSMNDLKPGDLLFKNTPHNHIVIYLGNGMVLHASNSKAYPAGGIKVSKLYFTPTKIARVIPGS